MRRWKYLVPLVVAFFISLGAAKPYQDPGRNKPCSPATNASDWKNTTYDAAGNKWTGERDLTLACVKPDGPSENNPCNWCYQTKIEIKRQAPFVGWDDLNTASTDLTLACDAAKIKPQGTLWSNLVQGRTYRVTSEIAVGPCDSPNLTFLYTKSITFTAN